MARRARAYTGRAKDAYLRRTIARVPGLDEAARARLVRRLQREIAEVTLTEVAPPSLLPSWSADSQGLSRVDRPARTRTAGILSAVAGGVDGPPGDTEGAAPAPAAAPLPRDAEPFVEPQAPASPAPPVFDPYSPNVVVVFRTRGRDAVLAALHDIDDVTCLRLLAREQQLGIAGDLDDASAIRQAIVAAAERRIANRRAAAS